MNLRPEDLDLRERYRLMTGSIVPRPIALVSTVSPDGQLNLAPYSFFNGVGTHPMTVAFCPGNAPDGGEKDTLRNAKPVADGGTGEFVVNVVTERNAVGMSAAAEPLAYGESEFELSGLTPVASVVVSPPRVAESPISFECETLQVIRTNPGAPGGGNLILGRVVSLHVDEELLDEHKRVDPDRLAAVGRMSGLDYCRTRERFEIPRGRAALGPGS